MFATSVALLGLVQLAAGHADFAITQAPAALPFKRQAGIQDCDQGNGLFTCPEGTCYYGDDGFVGCCRESSCAPRTRCIDFDNRENNGCDHEIGGCVVCSRSSAPYCVTNTNPLMQQYGFYCAEARRAVTMAYSYELPGGAVIRPVGGGSTTKDETTETTSTDSSTANKETATNGGETLAISVGPGALGTSDSGSRDMADKTTPTEIGNAEATEPSSKDDSGQGPKPAVLAAAVLGGVLGTLVILGIVFVWYRRRSKRQKEEQNTGSVMQQPSPVYAPHPSTRPGFSQTPSSYSGAFSNSAPMSSESPRESSWCKSLVAGAPNQVYRHELDDSPMPQISELGADRY
ncbi:hypothetical protein FZEAL_9831 [Fusarium zealandicum]|uniref:Uncharacterized protein n=1 Tax=Fusarium zealandicum TaxID=1053134 RepID=A0A8H4U8K9_9HYPO|nr:hypothetical protein FZEAL_9831 [Fusarium zealandicum]